jgi:hypothetical protein
MEVQGQDKKQFHKGSREVQLTGKLSAGRNICGPGVSHLPVCGTEHSLGCCKALLQPFHLSTPISKGLPGYGQLLSYVMDVVFISFGLLIVKGRR